MVELQEEKALKELDQLINIWVFILMGYKGEDIRNVQGVPGGNITSNVLKNTKHMIDLLRHGEVSQNRHIGKYSNRLLKESEIKDSGLGTFVEDYFRDLKHRKRNSSL